MKGNNGKIAKEEIDVVRYRVIAMNRCAEQGVPAQIIVVDITCRNVAVCGLSSSKHLGKMTEKSNLLTEKSNLLTKT